jgi:MFS family permease/predicted NBD/HSP70 family sugar kinase
MSQNRSSPGAAQGERGYAWYRDLTGYQWFVLAVASMGWAFDTMAQQLFNLARKPAIKELLGPGATGPTIDQQAAYATAIFMIGWAIGGVYFGQLGDKIGRAKTMMITILSYSLFTGLSLFATSVVDFNIYRFLCGLGVGGQFGIGVALVAETVPARARAHALGTVQAASALGNMLAATAGILLGQWEQSGAITGAWRYMFAAGALPAPLDPGFVPASLWIRAFREACGRGAKPLAIALERSSGGVSVYRTQITRHDADLNRRYAERLLKFLLWQKGGFRVTVAGDDELAADLRAVYAPGGARAFDYDFMGDRVYGHPMEVLAAPYDSAPEERESAAPLGRHLEGCRIGFDLGASDRKCAAVVDGKVVFSDEVPWSPSAQSDPQYHFDGIDDSLRRAAAHLPRVDAIGGSAAGVYVANEVRVGSLYRSVPRDLFDSRVRRLFFELRDKWGGVPFDVVNDGEVTALAGSMALDDGAVLGVAMGSSLAAGYVTPQGAITTWLNELAFVPVDYREGAPADEWSGDPGVGAQYFSQQAVGRLLEPAGIDLPREMPLPLKLEEVQKLAAAGDARAMRIYDTIGVYFGYNIATYAEYYDFRNLLVLGRVLTGVGGDRILEVAQQVLRAEFPELAERLRFHIPDEKEKRHGQAIAAASLPAIQA